MSFETFFASSVIFFKALSVSRGFSVLVLVRFCEQLPFEYYFALFVIIFPGVVDLPVLALFSGKEGTFRSSKFIISTCFNEILSLLLRTLLFRRVSFEIFSFRTPRLEEELSSGLK